MRLLSTFVAGLILYPLSVYASTTFNLGIASPFAAFSGSTVTNTGATNIYGNIGVWPGNQVSGFPPGIQTAGSQHLGDNLAMQAFIDINSAFSAAASAGCGSDLSGQNLGGRTLTAGVYCFDSAAQLNGALTLDAQGDPNAFFLFQITTSLTTADGSAVLFANEGTGTNVYWQVVSSANLGASSVFAGNILALGSITLGSGAMIQCGGALALNGAVTLDSNNISACATIPADPAFAPEPNTGSVLLFIGLPSLLWFHKRKSRARA